MKVVVIREEECIGCTKCIQACPFDAIIGAQKQMHTVLSDECIGCELCITPCPVDCIDIVPLPLLPAPIRHQKAAQAKKRYQSRLKRLASKNEQSHTDISDKKAYLEAAVLRAKMKKNRVPSSAR